MLRREESRSLIEGARVAMMGWEADKSYLRMGMHHGHRSQSRTADWNSHTEEEALCVACVWEARGH